MAALFLRFASGLARAGGLSRPQAPAREFLDTRNELLIAGRAAGAGAEADRLDHGGVFVRTKPLRPVGGRAAHRPPSVWGMTQ